MRTYGSKKPVWLMLTVMLLTMMFVSAPAEAKTTKRITTKSKTLSVGQEFKLNIKGLSRKEKKSKKKVTWKISDRSVVVFKGRTKCGVTIKARKNGVAKVTGIYKGKKYSCKITVAGNDERLEKKTEAEKCSQSENAKLNASEIDLYYLADEDRKYITQPAGHVNSFQFTVSGVSTDEIIKWSIESDKNTNYF